VWPFKQPFVLEKNMSVVESLLNNSYQDTQLLIGNDEKGDNFSIPRDIEFVLYAKDEKKADTVTSFINDNRYGEASFTQVGEQYRILVIINMPSTQHLICSVSGFMACIAALFSVEYDGWGCVLQKPKN
jgi:hypothetical protein